VVKSKYG
jgi:arsenate reductase